MVTAAARYLIEGYRVVDQDPAQALPADRKHSPLGICVRARRPRRRPQDFDALAPRRITAVRGFAHYLSGIDRATYRTLLGLLAASGLRIGEAISLDGDDID
jgi:integrase